MIKKLTKTFSKNTILASKKGLGGPTTDYSYRSTSGPSIASRLSTRGLRPISYAPTTSRSFKDAVALSMRSEARYSLRSLSAKNVNCMFFPFTGCNISAPVLLRTKDYHYNHSTTTSRSFKDAVDHSMGLGARYSLRSLSAKSSICMFFPFTWVNISATTLSETLTNYHNHRIGTRSKGKSTTTATATQATSTAKATSGSPSQHGKGKSILKSTLGSGSHLDNEKKLKKNGQL